MLIEPTESVGRADLDAFVEAMMDIDKEAQENPQLVIDAPHSTRIGRRTVSQLVNQSFDGQTGYGNFDESGIAENRDQIHRGVVFIDHAAK